MTFTDMFRIQSKMNMKNVFELKHNTKNNLLTLLICCHFSLKMFSGKKAYSVHFYIFVRSKLFQIDMFYIVFQLKLWENAATVFFFVISRKQSFMLIFIVSDWHAKWFSCLVLRLLKLLKSQNSNYTRNKKCPCSSCRSCIYIYMFFFFYYFISDLEFQLWHSCLWLYFLFNISEPCSSIPVNWFSKTWLIGLYNIIILISPPCVCMCLHLFFFVFISGGWTRI